MFNDENDEEDSPEITAELLQLDFNGVNLKAIRDMMQRSLTKNNMINRLKAKLSNKLLVNHITKLVGPNQMVIDLALSKLNLDNAESKLQYVTELVEFCINHYNYDDPGKHASMPPPPVNNAASANKEPSPPLERVNKKKKSKR